MPPVPVVVDALEPPVPPPAPLPPADVPPVPADVLLVVALPTLVPPAVVVEPFAVADEPHAASTMPPETTVPSARAGPAIAMYFIFHRGSSCPRTTGRVSWSFDAAATNEGRRVLLAVGVH
jgi:hypothetical protein